MFITVDAIIGDVHKVRFCFLIKDFLRLENELYSLWHSTATENSFNEVCFVREDSHHPTTLNIVAYVDAKIEEFRVNFGCIPDSKPIWFAFFFRSIENNVFAPSIHKRDTGFQQQFFDYSKWFVTFLLPTEVRHMGKEFLQGNFMLKEPWRYFFHFI